jgi:hypothetical protein
VGKYKDHQARYESNHPQNRAHAPLVQAKQNVGNQGNADEDNVNCDNTGFTPPFNVVKEARKHAHHEVEKNDVNSSDIECLS